MQVVIIILIILGILAFGGLIILIRFLILKNNDRMKVEHNKI